MDAKSVNYVPWNEPEPPTEEFIFEQSEAEGWRVERWVVPGGEYDGPHIHAFHKMLHVVEGNVTFDLPELGQEYTLRPGDRLELPPGVLHHSFVGPDGVAAIEGKRLL